MTMSAKPQLSSYAARLATRQVQRAVERVLWKRGLRAADIEDIRQNVLSRALVTAHPPPNLDECLALVRKIAHDAATDFFRANASRAKYDAGPYENPDDRASDGPHAGARDPVDARRQLDFVRGQIDAGDITARQAEILARAADGLARPAIAQELNLAPQTVRNELHAARRTVRTSWALYVAAAAIAAFGVIVWTLRPRVPVANQEPEIRPDDSRLPPEPSPLQVARDLRRNAFHDCDVGRWSECLSGLTKAGALDPFGDDDPRVDKARKTAAQHILNDAPVPPSREEKPRLP